MAFPRNSEGQLDIEAYVNILAVNPEAAQLMEDELINEDPDTINYFYDNVQRVIEEVRIRNNEELTRLDARRQELGAQKRVYVAAYEKSMQNTLNNARTNEGRPLTSTEQQTLNHQLVQEEINLLQQQPVYPQKTAAQIEKEENKRRIALLRQKMAYLEAQEAQNPQPSTQQATTNHHKTPKNRGCTIF